MNDRAQLRRLGIQARNTLEPETRRMYSRQIVQRIAADPRFQAAKTVMVYRALPGEVDLSGLETAGKRLVYPLCLDGGKMTALLPQDGDSFVSGYRGIMEPAPERSAAVSPEEIDLVICPCSAFDARGTRLGMGAGFYDRYLPDCSRAVIAAAAFSDQQVSGIPPQPWDIPMQLIFTEQSTLRIG